MKKRTIARNKATNNDTYCRECLCIAPSLFVLRSFFFFFLSFSLLLKTKVVSAVSLATMSCRTRSIDLS